MKNCQLIVFLICIVIAFACHVSATSSSCLGSKDGSRRGSVVLIHGEDAEILQATTRTSHVRTSIHKRSVTTHATKKHVAHGKKNIQHVSKSSHSKTASKKAAASINRGNKRVGYHSKGFTAKKKIILSNKKTINKRAIAVPHKKTTTAIVSKSVVGAKIRGTPSKSTVQTPVANNSNKSTPPVKVVKSADPPVRSQQTTSTTPIALENTVFSASAKKIIQESLASFNGALGPSNDVQENRKTYAVGGGRRPDKTMRLQQVNLDNVLNVKRDTPTIDNDDGRGVAQQVIPEKECVACRVDCMKVYSTLDGTIFGSCDQRYYYYGCKTKTPCFETMTARDDEIEGMLGICAYRNKCKFVEKWKGVVESAIVRDSALGRIRASAQGPE